MKYLGFARAHVDARGKRIAEACFNERSGLPTSSACVVASGVRETLSAHFGCDLRVRLFEPLVPSPSAWREIERDAIIFKIHGRVADAAVVLRPGDAGVLAAAAFGERSDTVRSISAIERTVVERSVRALSANLMSVCGALDGDLVPLVHGLQGFVSYFELSLDAPMACRIGVAVSRDPEAAPRGALQVDDLFGVPLELTAQVELPEITTAALLDLRIGEILPMTSTTRPFAGTLRVSGRVIGEGECGVSANRFAIALSA